jgi:hypothetical protein
MIAGVPSSPSPAPTRSGALNPIGRWVGPLAIAGAGAAMIGWTWGTWPDPLVDFGRELYIPWQIAQGKVLYRDIAHLNGPFSAYLNMLWFKLLGVSLRSLMMANIAIWMLLAWMLQRIFVEIGGRFSGTVACLVFVSVFSFGQLVDIGNYNFVCPYAHEISHGAVLSVAAIFCFWQYVKRGRAGYLAGTGLLVGLVFLTKAELFLAVVLAILAGLGLTARAQRAGFRRAAPGIVCLPAAALLPPLTAWVLFSTAMMPAEAALAAAGSFQHVFNRQVAALLFYRAGMGLDDPGTQISTTLIVASMYVLFFLPAAAVDLLLGQQRRRVYRLCAALPFIAVAAALAWAWTPTVWLLAARPLPLFLLAILAWLLGQFARSRGDARPHDRLILRTTMVVFALVLLFKILLNTRVHHYGFVLAMPGMLILVVALLDWAPRLLTRLGGCGSVFRAAAAAGLIVIVAGHLRVIDAKLATKDTRVADRADAFLASDRGRMVNWALKTVDARLSADESLLVVPEGVMVNYLSRQESPTPYINFMPPELTLFGEDRILMALRKCPPDYVLVVHKDTDEYGYRFFGRDYGEKIYCWVRANYEIVSSIGAPPLRDERFGMVLMRRVDAGHMRQPG